MPDPLTISECTIEELLSELATRSPAGAVSLLVPDDGQAIDPAFWSWGQQATVIGLSSMLAKHVSSGQSDPAEP